MNNFLIYGAYGYTGRLIVEDAVKKGWKPTIAGRDEAKVRKLAEQHDLDYLCFAYDDQKAWDKALADKQLLLNCAGPFVHTIEEILPACLRNGVHYTDIAGEIEVYEFIQQHSEEAKAKNIVLMPGVGFDIVPTDCLAKYLSEQMPDATHLELAFASSSGFSRGTALSLLNRFHKGSAIRENGKISWKPAASVQKQIYFGGLQRFVISIVWGDVYSSYVTTGIPNVEVFTSVEPKLANTMKKAFKFRGIIRSKWFQRIGRSMIRRKIDGPDLEKRNTMRSYVYGKVTNASGISIAAELETPESYKLTAITSLMVVERLLTGQNPAGYHTPGGMFGADFILKVEGVKRELI